ncbi:alkaline phosphatase family protein [Rubrivirga litoralis]|uniref:Alkaline phosphatase family protein n=1 Tax=Rubrivirga litoralis TaxID=3075598 RepID=A0ABU3BRM3_9BACT|nr:alkaline phosphatase family protein [Rubrivirga sp. F394]MDT0631937.1 alkaline phosphatase family protein [Rubrivirga sp. F394]
MTPTPRPALAAALAAVVLAGCGSFGRTVDGVWDVAMMGETEALRDPLRPVRGTTRVLVIAIDGLGDGALRQAVAGGDAPHLAALLGAPTGDPDVFAHAYAAPGVTAVLPSETAAGWAAVFTGRRPSDTGVVGNEWFDRDSLALYAPVPGSVSSIEQTVRVFSRDFLGDVIQTPTLFERAGLRSHVSLGFVHRGADVFAPPDANDAGELLDGLFDSVLEGPRALLAELDEDTEEGVRAAARRYGLPDLQVAYFPGADLTAHRYGADAARDYLRDEVDGRVGQIMDLYRQAGLLDSTYVVVVADHGHTPRLADDEHAMEAEAEFAAALNALGIRTRDVSIGADDGPATYQAVLGYNEVAAFVTLADRSTCPELGDACDWSRPPRLDGDVLPIARLFRRASDDAPGGPTIDLVLARASRTDAAVPFQVLRDDRLVPIADYLADTPRPDLVRLAERLD